MNEIRDRYISFDNIDCYNNAIKVLDAMYELFESNPASKNSFWKNFEKQLPKDYKIEYSKGDSKDILYLVCANVFYISDLFDEYDCEKGILLLDRAELECC